MKTISVRMYRSLDGAQHNERRECAAADALYKIREVFGLVDETLSADQDEIFDNLRALATIHREYERASRTNTSSKRKPKPEAKPTDGNAAAHTPLPRGAIE